MATAFTRAVSPAFANCELTHLGRQPIDPQRAAAQHRAYEQALARAGLTVERLPDLRLLVTTGMRNASIDLEACADLGVTAQRVKGRSGVWVAADAPGEGLRPDRKVAAIGIRVAQGVTMHGFALNCDNDLAAYGAIVPCGIADAGVTTLAAELGRDVTTAEVLPLVERHAQLLDPAREPGADAVPA